MRSPKPSRTARREALLNEIANIEDADEMLADAQDALRSRAAE